MAKSKSSSFPSFSLVLSYYIISIAIVILNLMLIHGVENSELNDAQEENSTPAFSVSAAILNDSTGAEGEVKIVRVELNNSVPEVRSKDRLFGKDSIIFEEYMKTVDLSLIPGLREDDDFENWTPPEEIQRDLPSYLSGFDYQNRPVWVVEYGKYNYTKYANSGRRYQSLFQKYFRYLAYVALKSLALRNSVANPVTQHVTLVDFEGLTPDHLLNPKALQLQLRWILGTRNLAQKYAGRIISINVNMLSESLFTLARSYLLSLLDRIEVYGTNKTKWKSQILKLIPEDQLPEWYGGSNGFKPIVVIG